MLKQKTILWNKINELLRKRVSYVEISKKLKITKDQIKYVAMTDKVYKNAFSYVFPNNKNLIKKLIKRYDKIGFKYKEIAFELNKKLHKLKILPNDIKITKEIVLKWRKKLGFKNKFIILKSDSIKSKKVINLLKKRKYSFEKIAHLAKVKKKHVEYIARKEKIRKKPHDILINDKKAWRYFKKEGKKLFFKSISYRKITYILNKDLHLKKFLPSEVILTKDGIRSLFKKLGLPIRKFRTKTHGLNNYKKFISQVLKEKKVISKKYLDNLMYKKFNLKKGSCEQIYLKLRWNKILASSIQRPLKFTFVNWGSKYKIKKYKNINFIWFTGKGRFTNADLINLLLLKAKHPLTFGQIVRKFKENFNLKITGWDLGLIINNERKRAKRSKKSPKIDVVPYIIKNNFLFLYVIPNKVDLNKINTKIGDLLIKESKKDMKEHLKGTIEGKELDRCLKNLACDLYGFKKDYVLKNKKRPDLIRDNKIVEIKKVLDTKTITSVSKKYGKYSKIVEIWYLYKKPQNLISKDYNLILKPISQVLNKIKRENLSKNNIKDFNYLRSKFVNDK